MALPPGRSRLVTKPAPTGSITIAKTIGRVRVACSNGATVAVPVPATRTSGASATNSAACLRSSSALVVAQRVSIRTLRSSVQPNRDMPCRNAAKRACDTGSSAADAICTPIRRIRSACCARAASGHAAAAPPSSVMNSRRSVAVGTCVSSHAPRTEPYVRLSRIRLPPRVCDGTSCRIRSSACDTRAWF